MNLNEKRVILASASPRRKEIFKEASIAFEVIKSEAEEFTKKTNPNEIVEELSELKAKDVLNRLLADNTKLTNIAIVGADTVVAFEKEILGKPKDKEDAKRMLRLLSGNVHQVYTGVTLIYSNANGEIKYYTFSEKTDVKVESLDEMQIEEYIETGEPMDKAGAYAIQGIFGKYILGYSGEYNNVVGFPIDAFLRLVDGID